MTHDAHLGLTAGALQVAALACVGPHTDALVASILEQAVWSIELEVATWEGSAGHVRSHRVCLGLTASLLGSLRGHPHIQDDVTRIVSVAVSARPNETVAEVALYYDPRAPSPLAASAYRGAPPLETAEPEPRDRREPSNLLAPSSEHDRDCSWEELARDYLVAQGAPAVARVVERARIDVKSAVVGGQRRHRVHVTFAARDRDESARVDVTAIAACLRDLLTGARGDVVRVD